ncbi:polysaccharide biosynthesis protein [Mucilaginibacter endophyticus]|uniref:polysaccharide biosynthesis protein n=1 Tax=Mucilaginibacter endophyticus TaxID=2675003 RepID=UPI000E0CC402|nr:polysaccharide biosynthesis protein [Mucilaginibacter endophyticus]
MKSLTSDVVDDNKFAKWQQWTKLIAVTFSAQAIIQLLGLVTGILIVRLLPTTEYAFYTLANTMLGTMTVLADGGISSGVMAQGGKVWQDRQKLGTVIASGLKLRKIFGMFSLLISLPILFYLLIRNGASLIASGLIVLAIIPSFFAALSDTLLETASKLHQGINKLQKNQLSAGLGRFVLMVGSLLVFPFTFIAILGNGIPRMWANIRLRKISAEYADPEQKADPAVEKEILAIVKRSLPGAIYFCVSGQITIWLISVFGNTQSIAHVGALSRLTTALTVFTTLFSTLVVPRFARLPEKKNLLVQRFIQIEAALFAISFIIIIIVMLFPAQVLWILGKGYSNLNKEILLLTISSCLTMLAGVTYSVLVSRGWIIKPIINLSVNILFQLILIVTMDLSKTTNVLMFSIVDFLLAFVILIIYFIYRVSRLPKPAVS